MAQTSFRRRSVLVQTSKFSFPEPNSADAINSMHRTKCKNCYIVKSETVFLLDDARKATADSCLEIDNDIII